MVIVWDCMRTSSKMKPFVTVALCVSLSLGFSPVSTAISSFLCEGVDFQRTAATTFVEGLPVNCKQHGTSIYCKSPTFTLFPQTLPPETTCVVIESGILVELKAAHLTYLRHLKVLGILNTPLAKLSGPFGKDQSLETLIFRDTSLSTLPIVSGNFKTLEVSSSNIQVLNLAPLIGSGLRTLNTSRNPLTTLNPNLLSQLPQTLESLDLLGCPIETIDRGTFPSSPNLKALRISVQTVNQNAFQGFSNVESFKIDTCRINSYAFRDLTNVATLDLSYTCKMHSNNLILERYAFSGMDSLTNMNLDYSLLKQIPTKAFSGLPVIQRISLRYNPLRYIMQGAFDGLTSLKEVYLSHVSKERKEQNMVLMGDNTFSYANLPSLTLLDISSLNLWNITIPTFRNLPNLEVVYFNSNLLHFLTNGTLAIPKLRQIRLGDNPWRCDCTLRWLKEMLDSQPEVFDDRPDVTCAAPPNLAGFRFIDLSPEDFKCSFSPVVG